MHFLVSNSFLCFSCRCEEDANVGFAADVMSIATFAIITLLTFVAFVSVVYDYLRSPDFRRDREEAAQRAVLKKQEEDARKAAAKEQKAIHLEAKRKAQLQKEATLLRRKLEKVAKRQEALLREDDRQVQETNYDQVVPDSLV